MKILLALLAFVAASSAYEFQERVDAQSRSVSSQVIEYIEKIQKQMPCGFPRLGLGPLSPARLSHREISLQSDDLTLAGQIDDFILYGLDDFDIDQFRINVVRSKVNFQFRWHRVHFIINYDMNLDMKKKNKIEFGRNGGAKFAIEDLVVVGTAKYNMINKLRLKELKVSASIGNVKSEFENLSNIKIVNKKLNEIIEEWILLAVNENKEAMEEMSNTHVVPLVNEMIGDATLSDLLGLILGGGGGSGGGSDEEECIPGEVFL